MVIEKSFVFVGSYADRSSSGIHTCRFDNETGQLEMFNSIAGLQNPTFLDLDEQNLRLYTLFEDSDEEGQKYGCAAAYQIDLGTGTLNFLNKEKTTSSPTCHITLDQTRQCLIVSSYHGGMIGLSPIYEDGRIGATSDVHQHLGSSIHPAQSQARAHSVIIDPTNQYAVASDLGSDQIIIYKLNMEGKQLSTHSEIQLIPGSGPRHFVFHPNLPYGYVINELNSTVTGFTFDPTLGQLVTQQTISTLPESYSAENACADIHISPDGHFLYGSNRGHDSIVVYAIDQTAGSLSLVEHVSTLGKHPRNFAISPNGRFLLVANKDTHNIVTFERNSETGRLMHNGRITEVSSPVCLKFLTIQ